jgi:hypothetical protein
MELPSLAAAWKYHYWPMHGTTIADSCMELPSIAALWNYHHWQLFPEYSARNPMTGLIWDYHHWQEYYQ